MFPLGPITPYRPAPPYSSALIAGLIDVVDFARRLGPVGM